MTSAKHKVLFSFFMLQTFAAAVLIASFYVWGWPFELVASFTQTLIALLLLSLVLTSMLVIISGSMRRNRPILAMTAIAWVAGTYALLYSLNAQQPIRTTASRGSTITFATFNKLYTNKQDDRYIDYFKRQKVDIVALQEMQPEEVASVAKRLGFEYSFSSRTFATSGGTAVAVISRFPFETVSEVELETRHPVVRAVIKTPQSGDIAVYSVHLPVPSTVFLYNKRNIVMESLAKTLSQDELPVIVGGDFNTTIYSPAMRAFNQAVNSTLQPVALERRPACSWYGYGAPFCIRIDHTYAPASAEITNLTISPDLGSDHRALTVSVQLQQ